jgi:hypothetical protein
MAQNFAKGSAITVGTAVGSIDPAWAANYGYAVFQVQGQSIRFRMDGGTPVAGTAGFIGSVGDVWELQEQDIIDFRYVRDGGTDGIIWVALADRG